MSLTRFVRLRLGRHRRNAFVLVIIGVSVLVLFGKSTEILGNRPTTWGVDIHYLRDQTLINCLTNGTFIPNANHNGENVDSIMDTIAKVWMDAKIPRNVSRRDGRCGNIGYEDVKVYRALCDPNGEFPCCYGTKCVNKPKDKCLCDDCRDMRQPIHPEFSDYKLKDDTCLPHMFDSGQQGRACDVLNKLGVDNIITFGDSLMRHVHVALLIHLRNDEQHGALDPDAGEDIHRKCANLNQFTEKFCRHHIQIRAAVCDNSVTVTYAPCAYAVNHGSVVQNIKYTSRKTLLIGSVGLHENLQADVFIKKFFEPILSTMTSLFHRTNIFVKRQTSDSTWPKMIFVTPHLPGILKGPEWDNSQNAQYTRRYAQKMTDYFSTRNVLVLNTHSMCHNAFSWDGTHYGKRFNLQISNIIFSYLESIKNET